MDLKTEFDLSGKVIIKVQLADDIRRIPIHNDAITYDELVLMMQRIFNGKLSSSDDITVKYKDEDGDLITINDSSDLSFAIQCSRVLKLILFINNADKEEAACDFSKIMNQAKLTDLKNQLRTIRDHVNRLLDGLDLPVAIANDVVKNNSVEEVKNLPTNDTHVNKINPSEFDPLQNKKKSESEGNGSRTPPNHQEAPNSRPQSVPIEPPATLPQSNLPAQGPQSDYYGQTPTSGYPQISQYGANPYAQPQYSYASTANYPAQVQPNPYVTASQGNIVYPNQPPQGNYSIAYGTPGAQVNPYSKNYNQMPQHTYNMQPR